MISTGGFEQDMISDSSSATLKALCVTLALLLGGMINQVARAQGAPPTIGNWSNQSKVNSLIVEQNGTCGFTNQGKVAFPGKCTWAPSARGGILTLTYPMPLEPGHIRWSIVYINQKTITIAGETFYKQ
jgi:hypothetical protein